MKKYQSSIVVVGILFACIALLDKPICSEPQSTTQNKLDLSDYNQLQNNLKDIDLVTWNNRGGIRHVLANQIFDQGNYELWHAMAMDNGYPLLQTVSFLCIRDTQAPSITLNVAVDIVLSSDRPGLSLMVPVYDFIKKYDWTAQDLDRVLSHTLSRKHGKESNIDFLLSSIGHDHVYSWLTRNSRKSRLCIPGRMARALDYLYESHSENEKFVEEANQVMSGYSEIPGMPSIVYSLYANAEDQKLVRVISRVLAGTDLKNQDDVLIAQLIIRRRSDMILKHYDFLVNRLDKNKAEFLSDNIKNK